MVKIHIEVTLFKYLFAEDHEKLLLLISAYQHDWHLPLDDGVVIPDWYSPLVRAPFGRYSIRIRTWECEDASIRS